MYAWNNVVPWHHTYSGYATASEYDKTTQSYGNFKGRSEIWWQKFIRQCHVMGFIEKDDNINEWALCYPGSVECAC